MLVHHYVGITQKTVLKSQKNLPELCKKGFVLNSKSTDSLRGHNEAGKYKFKC